MNRIGGKVTHKETGLGIPDLLVVIYDVDPNTRPEEILGDGAPPLDAVAPIPTAALPVGDRICSLATDADGLFEWEYEDTDFRIRNESEKRPDLLLTVVAPEETGQNPDARTLHVSLAVRQNAGRLETYRIRLSSDQLIKAGIPLPSVQREDSESSASLLTCLTDSDLRHNELATGISTIARKRVETVRAALTPYQTSFKPQLRATLSQFSSAPLEPERVVLPGESVVAKSHAVISSGIAEIVNNPQRHAPVRSRINLTDAQAAQLRQLVDANGEVDDADLRRVVAAAPAPATTLLVRENPGLQFCRDLSGREKECVQLVLDEPGQPPLDPTPLEPTPLEPTPEPGPAGSIPVLTATDIRRQLAHLMGTMTSPEKPVINGLTPRATRADVQEQIQGLSFAKSPADTRRWLGEKGVYSSYTPLVLALT